MNTALAQSLHAVLIGPSNAGKTTLFNTLTGHRQKVANYAGVTVSYKTGYFPLKTNRTVKITDLPGLYSLNPISPDEAVTERFFKQNADHIDVILCVVDASQLAQHLRLVLQVQQYRKPMIVILNRFSEATQKGIQVDTTLLEKELGVPVIPAEAKNIQGINQLTQYLNDTDLFSTPFQNTTSAKTLAASVIRAQPTISMQRWDDRIDAWVLHPFFGPVLLIGVMACMFQVIFSLAEPIKELIEGGILSIGAWLTQTLPQDSLLYSLVNDSLFGGLGTICAFCPQILLLFAFIFILEESGYLPRAVFLLDHLLFKAGLTGRAFIPLLSSFACTIPSIMATRNIQNPKDRLITILVLPLITCSARLPIYTLLISAFIPSKKFFYGCFNLQGAVLFGLYIVGMGSALTVAWIMKKLQRDTIEPILLMELPAYRFPNLQDIVLGLYEQLSLFLYRVGSVILALTILLWVFCRFPLPPTDAIHPPIYYSCAGYLGRLLAVLFQPVGFNWQICIALIPGLMAREVAISALGTVYAMSQHITEGHQLTSIIHHQWSLPTALSVLAWYVFAPQCLSTLTVIRRETDSWRNLFIAASYLFSLAYLASLITYQIASL